MSEVSEKVQALIEEPWRDIARSQDPHFSDYVQEVLRREWTECEQAPHPELCIKNAVMLNPALNQIRVVRQQINNFQY